MIFRADVLDTLDRALAYAVCDEATGDISYVSRSLELMFGYAKINSLIGKSIDELVPKNRRKNHAGHRADYAKNPTIRPMGVGMKLEGQRYDGSVFPVIVTLVPAIITATPSVIALVLDVTERTP